MMIVHPSMENFSFTISKLTKIRSRTTKAKCIRDWRVCHSLIKWIVLTVSHRYLMGWTIKRKIMKVLRIWALLLPIDQVRNWCQTTVLMFQWTTCRWARVKLGRNQESGWNCWNKLEIHLPNKESGETKKNIGEGELHRGIPMMIESQSAPVKGSTMLNMYRERI